MSTAQRLISAADQVAARQARFNSRNRVNKIALFLSLAAMGFGLFWQGNLWLALGGLFITGLGVASLYPLILALALGTTSNTVLASARASLASGTAILTLPLILGRLADAVGIQLAYGVVALLIASALVIIGVAERT